MPTVVTENITPAKAREYFNTSEGNRPISKVYVNSYADTMKKGGWMLNGVPIVFDVNGHLLDGHHRLLAIEKAGIPVRFDVVRGVSPDAFATYDNGRHRTVGQLLAMQGVKHYNLIGSMVSANERLIKSGRLYENNGVKDYVNGESLKKTNADYYYAYQRDPKGFEKVAEIIVRLQGRCRIIAASWSGGLYYFLTHTGGYSEAEVYPFFDALYSLDSDAIPVVTLLRKAITKEALAGRKMKLETLWAFIVKAWNSYITGDSRKILRYQSTEDLPELIVRS